MTDLFDPAGENREPDGQEHSAGYGLWQQRDGARSEHAHHDAGHEDDQRRQRRATADPPSHQRSANLVEAGKTGQQRHGRGRRSRRNRFLFHVDVLAGFHLEPGDI